jgi:hypothetical protein
MKFLQGGEQKATYQLIIMLLIRGECKAEYAHHHQGCLLELIPPLGR